MQASKMKLLQKFKGVTMFHKLRYLAICESLNIESLLLRIEGSQPRWFGYVSREPQERLAKQIVCVVEVIGQKPVGRLRTRWLDYMKDLGWNRLGLHLS